ncbi:MAG: hypothetical protein WA840_06660 [Caulobacteraceae bacterium]
MTPVSTASMFANTTLSINNGQSLLTQLTNELNSNEVSQNLAGYGDQAGQLTALNSTAAKLTSYVNGATSVSNMLDQQNTALGEVGTASQAALTAIQNAVGQNDGTTLMQTLQAQLTNAAGALNTQFNGQYLFSGGNVNTPPVANSDLSTLTTTASVTAAFQNGQAISSTQLGGNTTVQTGVLASNVATPLYNALQQVAAFNAGPNGPLSGPLTQAQTTFLSGVEAQFTTAVNTANNATADNGVVQSQVGDIQTNLKDQQTSINTTISDITNQGGNLQANLSSQINLANSALQLSAQAFQILQGSSLLNLLSPPTTA